MNKLPAAIAIILVLLAIVAALAYKVTLSRHQDATHNTQPPPLRSGQ